MPDTRSRRGPHPKDRACFTEAALPPLRAAVEDLSWLLSRGYSERAGVKLVGDRYSLRDRQRKALQRCAASDQACASRWRRRLDAPAVAGEAVAVDGYNVLLTLEAALSGGVLLLARDGTLKDLAAMSGHYRRVEATRAAVDLLAGLLGRLAVDRVLWYLDRPVSNSGRLKRLIEEQTGDGTPPWEVRLRSRTDQRLIRSPHVVATADSGILDRCQRWLNLARLAVESEVAGAWIVDLSGAA